MLRSGTDEIHCELHKTILKFIQRAQERYRRRDREGEQCIGRMTGDGDFNAERGARDREREREREKQRMRCDRGGFERRLRIG